MSFMVEENSKGNYEGHGHCEKGPAYPCRVMVDDKPRFWNAVNGYRDYDRDDGDHRDGKWKT